MTHEFDTYVEVPVRLIYEDSPTGPEVTGYLLGQPDAKAMRNLQTEVREAQAKADQATWLEHQLAKRD